MLKYSIFEAKYNLLRADIIKSINEPDFYNPEELKELNQQWELASAKMNEFNSWKREAERQLFISEYKKVLRQEEQDKTPYKKIAYTICPEVNDDEWKTCLRILEVLKTVSAIQSYKAVLEQRSKTIEQGFTGAHIHLSVMSKYPKSKVEQYVKQKLKSRAINAMHCTKNIKEGDNNWEDNYMKGNKFNVQKVDGVLMDRYYRKLLNIPDLFTFDRDAKDKEEESVKI